MAANRQFAEAINSYIQALMIRRQIDDREGIMVTLRNLGAVCVDASEFAASLTYFDEALKLARDLEQVGEAGVIAAYKGFSHKQLGQREEAIKCLRAGYELQLAGGNSEEIESTLCQLAEVHRESGEGDEMLGCYRLLRQRHRASGDRAGELKANLQMAETYLLGGRKAEALTLFEEGLRLSREVGDKSREDLCIAAMQKLREQPSPNTTA